MSFELEIIKAWLNLENQFASPYRYRLIAHLCSLFCSCSSRGRALQGYVFPGSPIWSSMGGTVCGPLRVWVRQQVKRILQMWSSAIVRVGPGIELPVWFGNKELWILDFLKQEVENTCQKEPRVSLNESIFWKRSYLVVLNLEVIFSQEPQLQTCTSQLVTKKGLHPDECTQMFLTSLLHENKIIELLFSIFGFFMRNSLLGHFLANTQLKCWNLPRIIINRSE